jgi:tetratricopeptide (TPR) repeat protein
LETGNVAGMTGQTLITSTMESRAALKAVWKSARATLLVGIVLLVLGLAVYGNAIGNPFVIDDRPIILSDARVQQGQILELLTGAYWPAPHGNLLYRPLVSVSFALNWAVCQEACSFRLVNLLLHVGVSLVLFGWARALLRSTWPALAAAALFVVHPIHTGPLNCIVGRAEIGAALFGLAATWLFWRDGADAIPRRRIGPMLASLSLLAALLCKENAIALVGVIVLLDVCSFNLNGACRAGGWIQRRVLRCYLPIVIAVSLYLTVRFIVLGVLVHPAADFSVADNVIAQPHYGVQPGDSELLARWGTPLAVFGKAAGLMIWPHPLCWDYSYAAIDTVKRLTDGRLLLGLMWLSVIVAAMIVSWHRARTVLTALGFSLITYSIVSNTYVVIGTVFAERLLYLPSVGFCLFMGILGQTAFNTARSHPRKVLRVPAAVLLGALCVGLACCVYLTISRNRDFRSQEVLNATDLSTNPRSSRLWCSVATDAYNAADFARAVAQAKRSIDICPEYVPAWRIAGLAHWRDGAPDAALQYLKEYFDRGGGDNEQANVAVADIFKTGGDYSRAIIALERFLEANPRSSAALNNLAWYLLTAEPVELRDPQRALPMAEKAIELEPGRGDYIDTYVSALEALGRTGDAADALQRLLPTVDRNDPFRQGLIRKLKELRARPLETARAWPCPYRELHPGESRQLPSSIAGEPDIRLSPLSCPGACEGVRTPLRAHTPLRSSSLA